ncbi:MAG: insulinase family protein [Bdellovibrionales bacterium]|nr:insulinase family protein [Bdellovibrionales bacterium]
MTNETPPPSVAAFEFKETLEPLPALKVHHYKNKQSGLDVFLVPQPGTGVVAYVTAYNVGSRYEVKSRTGIAHLFEHMMFRGTESFPEPFKTLSSWGDRFNAYTSTDLTLYHELVPKAVFDDVAKFESERMRKLLITKEGFNTERGAVVSERKMRTEDSPFGRLYWELHQTAFDVHPYKTGPIGWQEDLDATSFEDALDFYNRYYAPNRATITLVGDFGITEALTTLNKHYGSFKAQPWTEPKVAQEKPRHDMRRKVVPMKAETVFMADAAMGPRFSDSNAAADSLYCSLLADSKTGFLVGELVEKGIAKSVSGDCSPGVDPGLSGIFVVGNPGVSVEKLEKAYDKARKGFAKWVNAERVEQMKLFYLSSQYGSMREPMGLAEDIARSNVTANDPLYSFTFLEQVRKVSLDDVKKRFSAWDKLARTRLIIKPSDKTAPMARASK